jgi:hypothetical protein
MPRGGKRPGAGRKPGSSGALLPLVYSLSEAMREHYGDHGPDRLLRRSVIALAALAARIEEIAAVVEIPVERLKADHADDLELGAILRKSTLLVNLDAAATGRNRRTPSVSAMIAILRRLDAMDGTIRPRRRR